MPKNFCKITYKQVFDLHFFAKKHPTVVSQSDEKIMKNLFTNYNTKIVFVSISQMYFFYLNIAN